MIEHYFHGERAEMIALAAFSALAVVAAVALLTVTKDRFAAGLAIMLMVTAAAFASVAVPLLLRDTRNRMALERQMASGDSAAAVAAESARIAVVIQKYPYYRWGYVAMLAAAAIIALTTRSGLANGIATGLLLFAAAGIVVDHYSEQRAWTYAAALTAAGAK